MNKIFFCSFFLVFGFGWNLAVCQSPWLPAEKEFIVTPGFSFTSFEEFWVGEMKVSPLKDNGESLDQHTGYLSLEYGITPRLAADLTLGYTATSSTTTFGSGDEGLADTTFGLRYSLLDESICLPTLALRLGGTIAGTYDENTPFSAGDGASGFETSLLFGKSFGDTGFGCYGDLGFRYRSDPVPDEIFGQAGLFAQFDTIFGLDDAVTLNLGYQHIESLSGLDIMGRGFDPSLGKSHGFPALREINQILTGSVGYIDQGGRSYQFGVGKSLEGRNAGDKLILSFSISFAL